MHFPVNPTTPSNRLNLQVTKVYELAASYEIIPHKVHQPFYLTFRLGAAHPTDLGHKSHPVVKRSNVACQGGLP
jgi:hypothetical protein